MHESVKNFIIVKKNIISTLNQSDNRSEPKIIAVSKTFPLEKILPLINYGHIDFGENKVQEAIEKWTETKSKNKKIKLHLIGKLQRNKVKHAVKIFDYIHSVDSEKLAKKISDETIELKHKVKIFIQVNIGKENQKSGINVENLENFYQFCLSIGLNVVGIMCIPPIDKNPEKYFGEMKILKDKLKLKELSMGMSDDYLEAIKYSATYVRIGSSIFGKRN